MTTLVDPRADDLLAILFSPTPAAPTIARRPVEVKRYFYRCADCLSVVAIDGAPLANRREWPHPVDATCGACGGAIEFMGQVERDRLVQYEQLCACDGRCQAARGPSCDCRCGGENHGRSVTVEVRRDEGIVPVVQISVAARSAAEEYRALSDKAKSAIDARYGRLFEAKRRGEWIDNWTAYMDGSSLTRAWHKARELRSHAGRNKKLRAILEEATR